MQDYELPKVGAPETRTAVPVQETQLNERLRNLEEKIMAYYAAAGYELLGAEFVHSELSPELNTRLAKNQELKNHVRLLYTELQDAKEGATFANRKSLVDALEQDLADFESSFVSDYEEAA